MKKFLMLLAAVAVPLASLFAQEPTDSVAEEWARELELNEVVVVASRPVMRQAPDKIIYLTQNDPYAKGLNGIEILDRIPRVSVINDAISVAGKTSIRYIIDGHLLEMPDDAIAMQLKNLQANGIEKIELLTTPPSKYSVGNNVAFISITTKNESLGTRGNVWGNGNVRESFNYMLGGNISHTTRKIELSADAGWSDIKGINDLYRTFTFADYVKTSDRSNHFTNRTLGANALFKYKFSDNISAGAIFNYKYGHLNSLIRDITIDRGATFNSFNNSPARPNNAFTVTAFSDWKIDSTGKMLSLTYNYFNKASDSFSDVTTSNEIEETRLTNSGKNRYHIHSAKADATLPFTFLKLDAGLAYTSIGNSTSIDVENKIAGQWINDPLQTNGFDYNEHTFAAYASAEKNFTTNLFAKVGLRYEYTDIKGFQTIGAENHNNSYGYLFPSVTLSWTKSDAGRISASYSMGISRPNFSDLNPFRYYTTTTDYFSGNPDLNPSISHNAEVNYSFKGIYAVLYNSYNHDAIGYVTRFNPDGSQFTIPENFIDNNKTGLYASYYRSLFSWWNLNVGGEVFYNYAKSRISDFKDVNDNGWSGKLEINTSFMLNRAKTLIFNARFSHMFPYHDRMTRYEAISLIGCELRYMLLNNRLVLTASVNDPFGWNITKSTTRYSDYTLNSINNVHSHSVAFRVSWSFGDNKVNNVYRDTKEKESQRSY